MFKRNDYWAFITGVVLAGLFVSPYIFSFTEGADEAGLTVLVAGGLLISIALALCYEGDGRFLFVPFIIILAILRVASLFFFPDGFFSAKGFVLLSPVVLAVLAMYVSGWVATLLARRIRTGSWLAPATNSGARSTSHNAASTPATTFTSSEFQGPPCRFCGKPVRTAKSKQCPHCFKRWGDDAGPAPSRGKKKPAPGQTRARAKKKGFDDFMSIDEVLAELQIDRATLDSYVSQGKLRPSMLSYGGRDQVIFLRDHVDDLVQAGYGMVPCPECRAYVRKEKLATHMEKHLMVSCPECGATMQKMKLSQHMEKVHPATGHTGNPSTPCPTCFDAIGQHIDLTVPCACGEENVISARALDRINGSVIGHPGCNKLTYIPASVWCHKCGYLKKDWEEYMRQDYRL